MAKVALSWDSLKSTGIFDQYSIGMYVDSDKIGEARMWRFCPKTVLSRGKDPATEFFNYNHETAYLASKVFNDGRIWPSGLAWSLGMDAGLFPVWMLKRIEILDGYQGRGYGTSALGQIIESCDGAIMLKPFPLKFETNSSFSRKQTDSLEADTLRLKRLYRAIGFTEVFGRDYMAVAAMPVANYCPSYSTRRSAEATSI